MARVDPTRPLRIASTKRQVYAVWTEFSGPYQGMFWVDLRDGSGRRGFRYDRNGDPIDPNPWGRIENCGDFSPFESIEEVTPAQAYAPEKLAAKRQAEHDAMVDALGESEAFGLF